MPRKKQIQKRNDTSENIRRGNKKICIRIQKRVRERRVVNSVDEIIHRSDADKNQSAEIHKFKHAYLFFI